ncbi:MAG TPA: DUF4191 domain-containing protein [Kineosporiaceae bacterium]
MKSGKPARLARLRQVWQVFQLTREADPAVIWWMLLVFTGTLVLGFGLGLALGHPVYLLILAVPLGVLLALVVMARRAERAAYARFAGQPGASAMAFQNLRRGWSVEQEPVAVDPRTRDLVFRAVGRPGVVLVAEGPPQRVGKLAEGERKRVARVLGPNVPVTVLLCGDGDGQIPLRKLGAHMMRMKPTITKSEVSEVAKRLRALGGVRPPIPKGIDPTRVRPDRRAARGR